MFISLNWLREFVDLPKNVKAEELARLITVRSAEVEKVLDPSKGFDHIVLGHVKKLEQHPNADRLRVAQVDIGKKDLVQIVCGGVNLEDGMKVAVALPGAIVKWHGTEIVEMKDSEIRGVSSHGMICAGEEIGLKPGGEKEIIDLSHLKAKAGTPLAEALDLDDIVLEFDNKALTHRPDLWGHRGMAREIAAITDNKFVDKKPAVKIPAKGNGPDVKVENVELCPRYMAVIIRNVKVGASPEWMKQRLIATDHSVISNIVDVSNYVMEEIGQPLHTFDLKKIKGGIVVRSAKKEEELTTLDGVKHKLDSEMLVIADHSKALGVAGVMGGENSGISEDTMDILIESANFDAVSVRQSSIKLGIRTDSVQRFEKSLDPAQCEIALKRAVELILELCPGAHVEGPITDISNFDDSEKLVALDVARVKNKIGVDLKVEEMADYLKALGFGIQGKVSETHQTLLVQIPSYRATKDVNIEDDLVEEIARIYGYENLPAVLPVLPSRVPQPNIARRQKHEARGLLAGLGLSESMNYSFYSKAVLGRYDLEEGEHVKLLNALSKEQSHLRSTLIPNLLKSLREAVKTDPEAALFEMGRVFEKTKDFMPKEEKRLAFALHFSDKNVPFFAAKGILESFCEIFGVSGLQVTHKENPLSYMHPAQSADLELRGKVIGTLFTVHPALAALEDFAGRVAVCELNFEALAAARKSNKTYKETSKFPAIHFDVSFLIDKRKSVREIEDALLKKGPKILKALRLFDIYEGDKIEAGKKSLAFSLTLQAEDRTLTGSDLEEAQKLTWKILEDLGAQIRGK